MKNIEEQKHALERMSRRNGDQRWGEVRRLGTPAVTKRRKMPCQEIEDFEDGRFLLKRLGTK